VLLDGVFVVPTVILQVAFFPLPSFAFTVIVAVPFPTVFTTPLEDTVATFLLLELQVTALLLALLGATAAFKVRELPFLRVADVLFSFMLFTGCLTVTLQVSFLFFPYFAVITAVPFFLAFTMPFEDTVATLFLLLVQVIFPFVPVAFKV